MPPGRYYLLSSNGSPRFPLRTIEAEEPVRRKVLDDIYRVPQRQAGLVVSDVYFSAADFRRLRGLNREAAILKQALRDFADRIGVSYGEVIYGLHTNPAKPARPLIRACFAGTEARAVETWAYYAYPTPKDPDAHPDDQKVHLVAVELGSGLSPTIQESLESMLKGVNPGFRKVARIAAKHQPF